MGMFITREKMSFDTDIIDYDLEASNGWTPDCNGKWDYDPALIRVSSRVWNDGHYTFSVMSGDFHFFDSGILAAANVAAAKAEIEARVAEIAETVFAAVKATLPAPPFQAGRE